MALLNADQINRAVNTFPTPKAEKLLPSSEKVYRRWTGLLLQGFSDAEKENLLGYMERMMATNKA